MMQKLNIIILIIIFAGLSRAGNEQPYNHWLSLGWDNDFVFQTDRYYTNGLNIEYYNTGARHALIDYIHLNDNEDDHTFYGLSIQQDIFTPEDKNSLANQSLDRPFASYLMLASKKLMFNARQNMIRRSEFQIGMLGKYGGGEWVQNGIHSQLPTSAIFHGWENQIGNDILINYGLSFEKLLTGSELVKISGSLEGKVGLPYTYAGSGIQLRLGNTDNYFSRGNFYSSRKFEAFFYSGIKGRLTAYNATIQGGLFSQPESNQRQINHFLFELDNGVQISYATFKMNLGFKMISPEIKNGSAHRWGYVSFMFAL